MKLSHLGKSFVQSCVGKLCAFVVSFSIFHFFLLRRGETFGRNGSNSSGDEEAEEKETTGNYAATLCMY